MGIRPSACLKSFLILLMFACAVATRGQSIVEVSTHDTGGSAVANASVILRSADDKTKLTATSNSLGKTFSGILLDQRNWCGCGGAVCFAQPLQTLRSGALRSIEQPIGAHHGERDADEAGNSD